MLEKYILEDPQKFKDICLCVFTPTMNCNLFCSYCSMKCNIKRDNYYYATEADFQNLLNFLLFQDYKNYEFEFFGGEPTVHPLFKKFNAMVKDFFQDKIKTITTITNLAKPLSYWKHEWPKETVFLCSYHHWAMKNKQNEWFEKLRYLAGEKKVFCVRFVVTEENENEIVKVFEKYKREDLGIEIWELVVDERKWGSEWAKNFSKRENVDYGPKVKYHLNLQTTSEIIFKDGRASKIEDFFYKRKFYKMMCNCRFRVQENGDVYYCWNKADEPECLPILNAFKDKPFKVPEWHLCTIKKDCFCQSDCAHPKYSINYFMRHRDEI